MQRLQELLDHVVDSGAAGALMHYRDWEREWRGSSGVAELDTDRLVHYSVGPAELEQMLAALSNADYGLGIERIELPSGLVLWGHFGGIFGYLTGSYHSMDAR